MPEDEGQEEGAHLPEKVHSAGYRAGVIAANIGTYGVGDHHLIQLAVAVAVAVGSSSPVPVQLSTL